MYSVLVSTLKRGVCPMKLSLHFSLCSDKNLLTQPISLYGNHFFLPAGRFALHVFVEYFFVGNTMAEMPSKWRAFLPSNKVKVDRNST
jgi:hypothetical protein